MNPAAASLAVLVKYKSQGINGNGSVWRLDGNRPEVGRCKDELLTTICQECSPFVHYDDEPPSGGSLASCRMISPGVWRIPLGATGKDLLSWLYMGNWQLYVADEVLTSLLDLCRSKQIEVEAFVQQSRVRLVIDSFHDDTSWSIGLARDDA